MSVLMTCIRKEKYDNRKTMTCYSSNIIVARFSPNTLCHIRYRKIRNIVVLFNLLYIFNYICDYNC